MQRSRVRFFYLWNKKLPMATQENNDFCYWIFIENYYPKYHSCSNILLSDILNRKKVGEQICDENEEMIKDWHIKAKL